ncbi:hypothetical protein Taro_037988 [Colocasia esculenta]|uniref:Fe2OG dioxygenase domain-containing protein n=1 Tax=Colocasia esculenta TaxID=4460 RepID=A0A843WHU6_COLES|nr:hypothetical protein [Colocasia esculenta]
MNRKLRAFTAAIPNPSQGSGRRTVDLDDGSELVYVPRFLPPDRSWTWFDYLDKEIPWTRPTIHVFGKSYLQPRDTCYIANKGLPVLQYSGYKPPAYSWDDYPPLKVVLQAVHEALPGSSFNSLLLNRYKGSSDYVAWHSDDEKLYGPTPEIASVSLGCEREFLLRKKPKKVTQSMSLQICNLKDTCQTSSVGATTQKGKRPKESHLDQHSFVLKHGSLLVMRGYTQRDWVHSVPKRAKADSTRINLTFRRVVI